MHPIAIQQETMWPRSECLSLRNRRRSCLLQWHPGCMCLLRLQLKPFRKDSCRTADSLSFSRFWGGSLVLIIFRKVYAKFAACFLCPISLRYWAKLNHGKTLLVPDWLIMVSWSILARLTNQMPDKFLSFTTAFKICANIFRLSFCRDFVGSLKVKIFEASCFIAPLSYFGPRPTSIQINKEERMGCQGCICGPLERALDWGVQPCFFWCISSESWWQVPLQQ